MKKVYQRKMDAASLAAGIVGLAGLYNAVLAALENVDAYRKFGQDSRFIATRLELVKTQFREWADRVGLANASAAGPNLSTKHHRRLDDPVMFKLVRSTLLQMKERLDPSETAINRLDLADLDDDELPPLTADGGSNATARGIRASFGILRTGTSRKTKLEWVLWGKNRVMKSINEFEVLLEKLWKIIPPEAVDESGETGLTGTGDVSLGGGVASQSSLHTSPYLRLTRSLQTLLVGPSTCCCCRNTGIYLTVSYFSWHLIKLASYMLMRFNSGDEESNSGMAGCDE